MKKGIIPGFLFYFILCCQNLVNAQIRIQGIVKDSASNTILPYVNIGIKHKNIGTYSDSDGTFSIEIPLQNENDTLTLSMVGYKNLELSIKFINETKLSVFFLPEVITELKPIIISANKMVETKYGITHYKPLIHFCDGSTDQNDIFEIAQLFKLNKSISKITSLNLYINDTEKDSGTFRVNFYSYSGTEPDTKIIEKNIIQKVRITSGWLKFNLNKYNIYLKNNVVASLEFIPDKQSKNNKIYYELKLGGSTKSWARSSSQGEWNMTPHHFRMYLTALSSTDKNKSIQENEEFESLPTYRVFSEIVKDSFSIFVSLPLNYSKDKIYNSIYLLDANMYFDLMKSSLDKNKADKSILIGIGHKDFPEMDSLRNRDYTYPVALPTDSFPVSGGANYFLSFIEKELIPLIDSNYKIDKSNRTIMGHSLGGYFTLFALKKEISENNYQFKNFVAASPSLDYANQYLLTQFKNINCTDSIKRNLLISISGKEDTEDGVFSTSGMDCYESFIKQFEDKRLQTIKLKSIIFPHYRHMETVIPTFLKGFDISKK